MRVVNASPLILLSHLSRLDLLREPRPDIEVVVPQAVLDEVMRGKPDDPAVSLVPEAIADWLFVIPTPSVHARLNIGGLDPGEIAVLSVAVDHPGWETVIDDDAARRQATRLGIPCIGTVGLILLGRSLGSVPSVREALQTLRDAGMYISDGLFRLALHQARGIMPMPKLRPWYQSVTPREDLRENRPLDASEFAVHLDHICENRVHEDCVKPDRFFDRTYMTRSLLDLSAQVVRRPSGQLSVPVTTDIAGKKDAHAKKLDKEASESIRKNRLHQKVATVIFMESNGGQSQAKADASLPEIRAAVGNADINLADVETVLEGLVETCYSLNWDRNRYRFGLRPNLNQILVTRRRAFPSRRSRPASARRLRTSSARDRSFWTAGSSPSARTTSPTGRN